MKSELYRSKKRFPGRVVSIGRLNSGLWYVEGLDPNNQRNRFNSVEEIEKLLDDEFELVVPLQ